MVLGGGMMELGHPVRDLWSPSGELHQGLLFWAAIFIDQDVL